MNCHWDSLSKGACCVYCGHALRRDYQTAPARECKANDRTWVEPDYTADWFAQLGMNGEDAGRARALFGDCPKGDCNTARAWKDKVRAWWRGR